MPESFGGRLRQQRERQDVALATIAEQTKIKLSLLEGLERDDVSHWPTGIFRRAFVRAYAHAIGLEPDVIVREFLEIYPDPPEVVASDPSLRPDVERVHDGAGPPTRFRYLVSSAIGSLAGRRTAVAQERSRASQCPSIVERTPIAERGHLSDQPLVQEPAAGEAFSEAEISPIADASDSSDRAFSVEAKPAIDAQSIVELQQPIVEAHSVVEPPTVEEPQPLAACSPTSGPAPAEPDFEAAAHLCTELGRVVHAHDMASLLGRAAGVLDAVGLIVWAWDAQASALRAAVAHGYSDRVLAQLPSVRRDAANATAAAFRTAQPCAVPGSDRASGALVAPLITPDGCVGVLAIEWPLGREQSSSVRSVVTIFAALLARWISAVRSADVADRRLA